jgi:hypothetical protein
MSITGFIFYYDFFLINDLFECMMLNVDDITFRECMLILLLQKKVNDKSITFKIKDNEDNIKVVWDKKQHNINYEKGDKLQLFSFHLRKGNGKPILHSGNHSFIKVGSRQRRDLPKRKLTFALRL